MEERLRLQQRYTERRYVLIGLVTEIHLLLVWQTMVLPF